MRARSTWFLLSGALGGLAGFGWLELTAGARQATGGGRDLVEMGIHFALYGLTLGAALGVTEGVVQRRPFWATYGLLVGALLGAAGGFVGGLAGQTLYALTPVERPTGSCNDLALALDSSTSMKQWFFFGSDPWGARRRAAQRLVERLSPDDRVAIVDFDAEARVLFPLTFVTGDARRAAAAAIDRVDDWGGTDLGRGLLAAVEALLAHRTADRPRFVILLTDGEEFVAESVLPRAVELARSHGVTVHTVGLGRGVNGRLLRDIAETTGGGYHPVARAGDLVAVFEAILEQNLVMTTYDAEIEAGDRRLFLLRTASWALLGLLVGLGQGVRENTHGDLLACALGGLVGGAAGGALFNPLSAWLAFGDGAVGRGVAMVVVGACIGGTMRLLQTRIVERSGRPATTLVRALPRNRLALPGGGGSEPRSGSRSGRGVSRPRR